MIIDLGEEIDRKLAALSGVAFGGYRPGLGGYRPWYLQKHVEKLSDEDRARRQIEIEILTKARDALCGRCAADEGPHGCRAFAVRAMIAGLDPEESDLSPKDWMPQRRSKGEMRVEP